MSELKYRELLQHLEIESQKTFDKAVLTLSGGALGLSFAFTKDVVPLAQASCKMLLAVAWTAWALSIASILISHFFSVLALRAQIQAEDEDSNAAAPSRFDAITNSCNAIGGLLFLIGVILLVVFVFLNFGE